MPSSSLWSGLLPICALATWLLFRGPIRSLFESRDVQSAQEQFRREREYLEARFLSALARKDPLERIRWEDAQWQDEVIWARDRQSRRLLALIGLQFENDPGIERDSDDSSQHATALFVYRDGRWSTDGDHLDSLQPTEAVIHHRQIEPIVVPQKRL